MSKKVNVDMWYGDRKSDINGIDVFFSDVDCMYSGNLYIDGKAVGDFSTRESAELEKTFKQFDWSKIWR